MTDALTLKTRPMPRQARGRARLEAILSATARLLETEKPERLSTTLIAAEAGMPVSSLYRYFPSAEDVLRELYLQCAADIRARILAALAAPQTPWRTRLATALRAQSDFVALHPYYRALMLTFLTERAGLTVKDEGQGELGRFLIDRWSRGLDGFSGADPRIVAPLVVQMALAVEEMALNDPDNAEALSAELFVALERYLSAYLRD